MNQLMNQHFYLLRLVHKIIYISVPRLIFICSDLFFVVDDFGVELARRWPVPIPNLKEVFTYLDDWPTIDSWTYLIVIPRVIPIGG